VLASVQDKNSNPNSSSEDHSFIKQHFPSVPKAYQMDKNQNIVTNHVKHGIKKSDDQETY